MTEPRLTHDEMLKNGVPKVEVYPDCEHRFKVELPTGEEYCHICGTTLKETE